VGEWKTPYELVLTKTTPDEVRAKVARHRNHHGSAGLHLTMRSDVLTATVRDSPWTHYGSAPLLRASLTQDERGTVITGTLSWSGLLTDIWSGVLVAPFLVATPFYARLGLHVSFDKLGPMAVLILTGVTIFWLSLRERAKESEKRAAYLADLNRELEAHLRTST